MARIGATLATETEVSDLQAPLAEGELIYVQGAVKLLLGDGVTTGGVVVYPQAGVGAGGGGPAFRIVAVSGTDPSNNIVAEIVGDTLTLIPSRGIVLSPNAANDSIAVSLPDGGAFGNGLWWTGSAYVPGPAPSALLDPQVADYSTIMVVEDGGVRYWDSWVKIDFVPAPTSPAAVVTINGMQYASLPDGATGLLRAVGRIPNNLFDFLDIAILLRTDAVTGSVRLTAQIDRMLDVAASPSFAAASLVTAPVPGAAGNFLATIRLAAIDGLAAGEQFRLEFGRLGADGADGAAASATVVDAWMVLA